MAKNGQVALVRRAQDALARTMEPLQDSVLPAADIYETADAFILKVDMPGAMKDSIGVQAASGRLQIKGAVASVRKENVKLLYSEMCRANYFRTFNISNGIDAENIEAHYDDGVLTLVLPKNESTRVKEIPIK